MKRKTHLTVVPIKTSRLPTLPEPVLAAMTRLVDRIAPTIPRLLRGNLQSKPQDVVIDRALNIILPPAGMREQCRVAVVQSFELMPVFKEVFKQPTDAQQRKQIQIFTRSLNKMKAAVILLSPVDQFRLFTATIGLEGGPASANEFLAVLDQLSKMAFYLSEQLPSGSRKRSGGRESHDGKRDGPMKNHCAITAHQLLESFGRGKRLAYTPGSQFCSLANMLYRDGANGDPDAELDWHCRQIIEKQK